MAQLSNPGVKATIVLAADVVANRFIGGDGQHCGAGLQCFGVSIAAVDSGQACTCTITGIAIVESGAAVNAMNPVKSDASGRAVGAIDWTEVVGIALDAATAAGQFIRVKL